MKKYVIALCLIAIVFANSQTVFGCTCTINPLKDRFRKANAVFVGKLADERIEDNTLIQNNREGLFILEVIKSWKGIRKEYVGIDLDFPPNIGGCPLFYKFELGKEYLVFAYGKELKIQTECSDTAVINSEYYSYSQKQIRKLDSFGFRFWARIFPF